MGWSCYVVAFVLACSAWLGWRVPLHRAAFWLIVRHVGVHTAALIGRIYISGRPPVTNLYSRRGVHRLGRRAAGHCVGSDLSPGRRQSWLPAVAGFAGLLIAHLLAASGDTFTVLAGRARHAVLAGHARRLHHAGLCHDLCRRHAGHDLLARVVLRARCSPPSSARDLTRMIYGVLCFAIFFSFCRHGAGRLVGRRFLGPLLGLGPEGKRRPDHRALERPGAACPLGRPGAKTVGWRMLAIGGNIAVSWSLFGVNELGVGLHSYGFTEGVKLALIVFVASQLALIAAGAIFGRRRDELPSASRLVAEQ